VGVKIGQITFLGLSVRLCEHIFSGLNLFVRQACKGLKVRIVTDREKKGERALAKGNREKKDLYCFTHLSPRLGLLSLSLFRSCTDADNGPATSGARLSIG